MAEDDADVFDGVVLIDVEVTGGLEFEIEPAMLGEEFEHVIQESNAGRYRVLALAFNFQLAADLGFLGDPFYA